MKKRRLGSWRGHLAQRKSRRLALTCGTTMTLAWTAERLRLGAPSHVARLLYREKKNASDHDNGESTLF